MTDLQAAVGVGLLPHLSEATARRQANAAALTDALTDIPGVIAPTVPAGRTHVFHQYTVRVTPDARLRRDELAAGLAEAGIGTGVYYPQTIPAIACYVGHPQVMAGPIPIAERAANEVLSLPVHHWLTDADVDRVATTVRKLVG
jgi:dTDP-4-amino-4,6-dideoxygalactose transaminase